MRCDLASTGPGLAASRPSQMAAIAALVRAGFRRYSTYRQATVAAIFTNSIFGFLRCYVLLAVLAGSTSGALSSGYDAPRLALYCWASQGLIGVILLWGWSDLGDRIRSGDVVADLLRPVHPVTAYLATDLGRAAHAALTRFVVPVVIGLAFFTLHLPQRWWTYPLFVVSVLLGVVVSFCCRFLVNAAGYWLLDTRGVALLWTFAATVLAGLAFPLHFLPPAVTAAVWLLTPVPSVLQAPLDVLVEYGSTGYTFAVVGGQAVWAAVMLAICRYVQSRADRRLVIQGG